MSLPRWLSERIGTPTRGRGCRHTKCLVCQSDVLAGFDEDRCALAVVVDPAPLTALSEALALLDGRRSYELKRLNQGLALWYRDWHDISARPASDANIVMTDHKCGAAKLPSVEIKPAPKKEGLPYDAEPPF